MITKSEINKRKREIQVILDKFVSKLIKQSSNRTAELDTLIKAAKDETSYPEIRLKDVKLLKRSMDMVAQVVKDCAVQHIIEDYTQYYQPETLKDYLPTPSQIIFFFQRQKDRNESFARSFAAYFSRTFNTMAPMEIIERERMDFSEISFGPNQVELAEEVAAIDYAFEHPVVNMGTVDDLLGCIRVSNKTSKRVLSSDAEYARFSELWDQYDIGGILYRLPELEDSPLQLNNNNPSGRSIDELKDESRFLYIDEKFLDNDKFDQLVNFLVQNHFIEDDPTVKKIFKYRFIGTPQLQEPLKSQKIIWRINALRANKRHPGELFSILSIMTGRGAFNDNAKRIEMFFSYATISPDGKIETIQYILPKYPERNLSDNDSVRNVIRNIWNIQEH